MILYLEGRDGSLRAIHWSLAELVAASGEISPPERAPSSPTLTRGALH